MNRDCINIWRVNKKDIINNSFPDFIKEALDNKKIVFKIGDVNPIGVAGCVITNVIHYNSWFNEDYYIILHNRKYVPVFYKDLESFIDSIIK